MPLRTVWIIGFVLLGCIPLHAQSNYAIEFDGIDDRLEIPSSERYYAAPAFTWELWFNGADLPTSPSDPRQALIKLVDNVSKEDMSLGWGCIDCANPRTELSFQVDGFGQNPAQDTPLPIGYTPDGGWINDTWYHVAAVRNFTEDSIKLYINGELVAEKELIRLPIPRPLCTTFDIGACFWDCYMHETFFKGMLADIRIWNTARTPHEIQNSMYTQFNGNEPGLVGLWTMREGSGTVIHDGTVHGHHATIMNGAAWVESNIIPPYPPAAPSNLSASAISPTKAQLSWSDNSMNETRFIAEYRLGEGQWMRLDSTFANTNTMILENLQPETKYDFRVIAVNPYYASPPSNTASATTPEFVGPSDLVATAFAHNTIRLQWKDNSPYETAQIVEKEGAAQAWEVTDTVSRDQTTQYVTGLQSSTTYTFRVRALEGRIPSPPSNEAEATTLLFLEVPENLTAAVLSCTELRLDWQDMSTQESGFEIEQRIGDEEWTLLQTANRDETTLNLDGLTPRTTYRYRIRAVGDNAASS
ncbi:MAG: fibronectin type III domain-containing protein [Bacteroidetes bacterium]|nr:fibronectin type III domain-containing protein [Bacteroidota bacterium]